MKNYQATVFSKEKYKLGESPFYDARTKVISWVDILTGMMYLTNLDGVRKEVSFNQRIGAAVPGAGIGSYVIAGSDGLYLWESGTTSLLYDLSKEYQSYIRSNDAKADPKGRLWFGSSVGDDKHEPEGNLYCYHNATINCMQGKTRISNGMAWSDDGKKFYFSDSLYYAVFVYDFDMETGSISNRQVLFDVENGVPDGMCIDTDDNLWVAIWGGNRIEQRSTKNGEKLSEVILPATNVTSCCFVGDDLDTLFITSSGDGLEGEYDGCLFTCKVDKKGKAPDYAKIGEV